MSAKITVRVVESTLHLPMRNNLREFQKLLNADTVLSIARKHPKRLKLTAEEGAVKVRLEKELREPTRIEVGKTSFVRTCTWGNTGAETLVRHNLGMMIRKAKEVGKWALANRNNAPFIELCLNPDSDMSRVDFLDTQGNPMKADQRAVYETIKQFFKDTDFMRKLKAEIKREFYELQKAASKE